MKNLFIFLLLTFSTNCFASNFSSCPPQISPLLAKVEQLPEIQILLNKVIREEGPIAVRFANSNENLEAFWDGSNRAILINPSTLSQTGTLISSLIFELHNASTNRHFMHLVNLARLGQINKEQWVEQVEKMEHQNALQTMKIIEKGIANGDLPTSSQFITYYQFTDYYKLQQISGHSVWLAEEYSRLNPSGAFHSYNGTIPGLRRFSQKDKENLLTYLSFKNQLSSPTKQNASAAREWLQKEWAQLKNHGDAHPGISDKMRILAIVFDGTLDLSLIN